MLFLVVDDDALSRDLLSLLLEAEGYEAESAASGEAAVAHIAACAALGDTADGKDRHPLPEVILTDIQMPGLAGDALVAALREQLERAEGHGRKTLLLAMSGSQPKPSALTGFDGFLLKPFQMSELRLAIHRASPASQKEVAVDNPEEPAEDAAPASGVGADELPEALDEEIYAKMRDLMPAAQLGEMYALCVDDARRRIAHMGVLAAEEDDAAYRKEAHAVKGGSGMIGASELYALAAAAEHCGLVPHGPNPGISGVTATLARLSLACERLERILQERTRE